MTMMSGVVESVQIKEVNTKFGAKPTYTIKVDGKFIKCGFKNPNVEVGYTVDFDAVAGTYGLETKAVNIVSRGGPSTVTVAAPTAAVSAAPSKPAWGGGGSSKVFPIPALHGDRSIVRQNALARATEIFIAARGGKPFDLDVTNLDLVISFARRFEAYTAGDLDLAEAMADVAAEEKAE